MRPAHRSWIIALGSVLLPVAAAKSQPPQPPSPPPFSRPTVSPYLNLFRQGTPPAINYYNLVRPQNEFMASIQQLQQQTGLNREGIANLRQSAIRPITPPPTGFVPQFFSHRTYFMNYTGFGGFGNVGALGGRAPLAGSPAQTPAALPLAR